MKNITVDISSFKIGALKKLFAKSGITVIGGNDSMGVPSAIKSNNGKAFIDQFTDIFAESKIKITYINFFSMRTNKVWHIDRVLKHNLSVAEIKTMQSYGVDQSREKLIGKIGISPSLKNNYQIFIEDFDTKIADELINASDPVFIYSCGANNIMHKLNANPIDAVLNEDVKKRVLTRIENKTIISKIVNQIDQTFNNIYSLNPNTTIVCLGLYVPIVVTKLAKKYESFDIIIKFMNDYNMALEEVCKKNNVEFIDTSDLGKYCAAFGMDFHLNQFGHNALFYRLVDTIYESKLKNKKVPTENIDASFEVDDKGLMGMAEDAHNDYLFAMDRLSTRGFLSDQYEEWSSKASEYSNDYEMFTMSNLKVKQLVLNGNIYQTSFASYKKGRMLSKETY